VESSASKPSGATVTTNTAQSFEWIQHGDASARKRARAHVTRGFRREKAALAKANATRRDSDDSSEGGSPRKDSTDSNAASVGAVEIIPIPTTGYQPGERADSWSSEEASPPVLDLSPTLGSGRGDPFACMPIDLGPGTHALLDHCTCVGSNCGGR
jgi:hypothetical protein